MLGAIAGDFIGSRFEGRPTKKKGFSLITSENTCTDDTILTIAIADSLISDQPYYKKLKEYYRKYPWAGYGGSFQVWASSDNIAPYYSFGNGSAMRVSPIGWFFQEEKLVLQEAENSAAATHNHPEGIKGAQATALAIFLARMGQGKNDLKKEIQSRFDYDLNRSLKQIRTWYRFDVTCQGSVPEAIIAFLEAEDYEDAIRNAVSLGGDSDTQACIAGAIAEAFFGPIPEFIGQAVFLTLDEFLLNKIYKFQSLL